MSLPEGTPGSRTHYTIEITAREKEACERFYENAWKSVVDDIALVQEVLRKIALLPKKSPNTPTGAPPEKKYYPVGDPRLLPPCEPLP